MIAHIMPQQVSAGPVQSKPSRWKIAFLFSVFLVAVIVRLAWVIHKGSADFWAHGTLFYDLAVNLASGRGLCTEAGCAIRAPYYPSFLAATTLAGKSYLWVVVPQALMGAGTALCAYLIGKRLFNESIGMLGSLLTALYPYYVVNDTALEETGMFTFLTALSVFLLLGARSSSGVTGWTMAGFVLGAAVLTDETLLPFAVGALLWIGLWGEGSRRRRMDRFVSIASACALLVGVWMARNYMQVGTPVLTSELGWELWIANNPKTFSHHPVESMDRNAEEALSALSPAERQELDGISDEILKSDWFEEKAFDYMKAHPLETVRGAARRLLAAFSWSLDPSRETSVQLMYFISYAPISLLGSLGMILTWRRWKEVGLIYLLFLTFAGIAAIFYADTRQRSYLDVYWIVFAAYVLNRYMPAMVGRRYDPIGDKSTNDETTDVRSEPAPSRRVILRALRSSGH